MKVKTSIMLSKELLQAIDKRARQFKKNRSDIIEAAVCAHTAHAPQQNCFPGFQAPERPLQLFFVIH
jgi:metal-responsive CopG/Arc/MetJ family transcriptional regulator